MNNDGSLLATTSEKGKIIRIFRTEDGEYLHELRRGSDKAEIYSISFNYNSKLIACSSSKSTIHVFSLSKLEVKRKENKGLEKSLSLPENSKSDILMNLHDATRNTTSFFSIFKGIVPYFSSEWSFAQFKMTDSKPICSFIAETNRISVVTNASKLYEISFDLKRGGYCKIESLKSLSPF